MKRLQSMFLVLALPCVFAIFGALSPANAVEKSDPQSAKHTNQSSMPDSMMAKWMLYASPGAEHTILAKTAGPWKFTAKMWMDPDGPPSTGEGNHIREMILGGRFLQMKYSGAFGGMPFEGEGLIGFDKFRNVYNYFWIDNMTTAMQLATAPVSPNQNELVFRGNADEPMTGERDQTVQYIHRMIDDDHFVFELWDTIGGKLVKVGEIMHERVKIER